LNTDSLVLDSVDTNPCSEEANTVKTQHDEKHLNDRWRQESKWLTRWRPPEAKKVSGAFANTQKCTISSDQALE
jgi:hypothetical protein